MPTPARLTRSPTLRNTTRAQAVATDRSSPDNLTIKPESVIRIRSVFLLYIERIFVVFFCRHSGLCQEKDNKKRPIENKKTTESINA